jgi:hypothetical protein
MIKKILLFFLYSTNCLLAQTNNQFVGFKLGYGELIQQRGQLSDFSTLKYGFFYLIEKKNLALRGGYSNEQTATFKRNITQNTFDGSIGYHWQHRKLGLGVSNLLAGVAVCQSHGVDATAMPIQIFNLWSLGLIGVFNQRIFLNKKWSFYHEFEGMLHTNYNTLSYTIGLTFKIKTDK